MIGDRRSRRVTVLEERHGLAGARRTLGSVRGHVGAPHVNARAMSGPLAPDRGAPRLGRGASERWGVWGAMSGPLTSMGGPCRGRSRRIEERHGLAGARRTLGGV